ncbi:MAG: LysM peptidoglycan-binding domain-containing protein [Acidobacteria bacterium]|nr:LysM peptidoglycan-binding domain-containing protein [Acidobacteriota bacterium]
MDRFEELKSKYQPVLRLIEQSKVRLQNLHVQDNKLFLRASAPTQEVKNRIWDQIKLVNPKYDDLTADITIDAGLAPPPAPAAAPAPPPPSPATYTVQPGDTLSKISKQHFGDANKYMRIFEANRDQLDDPNKIRVGQVLKIPKP